MDAGSKEAILYEIRHGDIFTVIDEIWHKFEWFMPSLHFRFCQWAHNRKEM